MVVWGLRLRGLNAWSSWIRVEASNIARGGNAEEEARKQDLITVLYIFCDPLEKHAIELYVSGVSGRRPLAPGVNGDITGRYEQVRYITGNNTLRVNPPVPRRKCRGGGCNLL
jgi:hypothetical protein